MKHNRILVDSESCLLYDWVMWVEATPEEAVDLIRWKKRFDTCMLVRMKAEATLYASEGGGLGVVAKMVWRSERTIRE